MFDVRFGVDSIFDRTCKAGAFCVTISLILGGAVWDITKFEENKKGFSILAVALTIARVVLVLQYAVVAWYARAYKRAVLPLILTMVVLTIAGVCFLAVHFVIEKGANADIHHAFYIIVAVEGVITLFISSFWRIVSFKDTRFITRMTDSTMIMLGEGAVGLATSVGKIMSNSNSISSAIGVTIAGVLLIYFTWMLYFDQIETSRFGTIRQQVWGLMHFPLNLATVFILEGMRELVAYRTINDISDVWWSTQPTSYWVADIDPELPEVIGQDWLYDFSVYPTSQALVDEMKASIKKLEGTLGNSKDFEKKFNATPAFDFIIARWNETSGLFNSNDTYWYLGDGLLSGFVELIYDGIQNAIYEHFGVTPPDTKDLTDVNRTSVASKLNMSSEDTADLPLDLIQLLNTAQSLDFSKTKYNELFDTIFWYFPLGAAFYLLILAGMYWFGKRDMVKYEWWSVWLRVFGGLMMIMYSLLVFYLDIEWKFSNSSWPLPIVTLAFFVVILGDNLLITWGNKVSDQEDAQAAEHRPHILNHNGYQNVPSRHGDAKEVKFNEPALVSGRTVSSTDSADIELVKVNQR